MSYCRMENTFRDLIDCETNFNEITSQSEQDYAVRLIQTCQDIARQFGLDSTEEQIRVALPNVEEDDEDEE